MTNLCKVVHRPNGDANHRIKISGRAENDLNLFVYHYKNQDRLSCSVSMIDIYAKAICNLAKQCVEISYTDPNVSPTIGSKE